MIDKFLRITQEGSNHGFKVGELVRGTIVDREDGMIWAESVDYRSWWLEKSQFEVVEGEESKILDSYLLVLDDLESQHGQLKEQWEDLGAKVGMLDILIEGIKEKLK